jgi:hypothetical protein
MENDTLYQDLKIDPHPTRRDFLKIFGIGAVAVPLSGFINFSSDRVSIIVDPLDKTCMSAPVQWAVAELTSAFTLRQISVQRCNSLTEANAGNLCIIPAGFDSRLGATILKAAKVTIPTVPEALGLVHGTAVNRQILLASGYDERGLIYALLELTDRVNNAISPLTDIRVFKTTIEQPANKVRSLNRLFVSDIEDKPWYNDREMWPQYLTMLATQRFNQFNLSFGIGYDFLTNVTDAYFLFAYPFLLSVPGYKVYVPELPDTERDQNLAMLQYISEQTVARGLKFRLGLWMHGYEWLKSPNPNYTIKGLTAETHAAYCRDALRMLLKVCPAISGITFRVHGESGVTEGSYEFWKTIFDGLATCGRVVEFDLHAKGIDQQMLNTALSVGVPIAVSPKFWAEHMGMPYHQADIRELEIPKPDTKATGLMNLSAGSRSFTRYGYGDYLKNDRKYDIVYRIWPGTQRLLLWGDPVSGAAQSKIFSFCESAGVELMEPLSFKGRRGSGIPGDRCGYEDTSLKPKWDWEKYLYSLRVFGRTLYNPDTDQDVWNRYLRKQFGAGATNVEKALASATRILPTVLTAHGASAGNNVYWPEMYTNMPISNTGIKNTYSDTPPPKTFGMVSPLDPQLFLSINEFVLELLKGGTSGKYTPIEVAQWLMDHADTASNHLALARNKSTGKNKPEFKRMVVDVALQIGLGKFFAYKLRAGALFSIYENTGDAMALEQTLIAYRTARNHWVKLADTAKGIYKSDVTAGELSYLRGHWIDRLPVIDEDIDHIAALQKALPLQPVSRNEKTVYAVNKCIGKPERPMVKCLHKKPEVFKKGHDIAIEISFEKTPEFAKLYYRHINHAERYVVLAMEATSNKYKGIIPAEYTNSPYDLAYYFEVAETKDAVTLFPGFNNELINQPYFLIHQHKVA